MGIAVMASGHITELGYGPESCTRPKYLINKVEKLEKVAL
jgi:hypothetical protein